MTEGTTYSHCRHCGQRLAPGAVCDCRPNHDAANDRATIARLTAELAAVAQQRDEMAAALGRYKVAIERFGPDEIQLEDDTMYHSPDCTCDRCEDKSVMESLDEPHSAILAARDARMKAEGAAEALEEQVTAFEGDGAIGERVARRLLRAAAKRREATK